MRKTKKRLNTTNYTSRRGRFSVLLLETAIGGNHHIGVQGIFGKARSSSLIARSRLLM